VTLDTEEGTLTVVDVLTGSTRHTARLFWHLGPDVSATLRDGAADLSWPGADSTRRAHLELPEQLEWTAHRGETDPIIGWYSPRFGERVPSTTLVGAGVWTGTVTLRSVLQLSGTDRESTVNSQTASKALAAGLTLGDVKPGPRGKQ